MKISREQARAAFEKLIMPTMMVPELKTILDYLLQENEPEQPAICSMSFHDKAPSYSKEFCLQLLKDKNLDMTGKFWFPWQCVSCNEFCVVEDIAANMKFTCNCGYCIEFRDNPNKTIEMLDEVSPVDGR